MRRTHSLAHGNAVAGVHRIAQILETDFFNRRNKLVEIVDASAKTTTCKNRCFCRNGFGFAVRLQNDTRDFAIFGHQLGCLMLKQNLNARVFQSCGHFLSDELTSSL